VSVPIAIGIVEADADFQRETHLRQAQVDSTIFVNLSVLYLLA